MSNRIIIKNARGLTVPELLYSVSIVCLLVVLGAPSFSSMMDKQRLTGACHEAFDQLIYARSSAVKINKNVSISFKSARFYFDEDNDGVKEPYSGCIGLNDASVSGCNCAGASESVSKCTVNGRLEVVRFPEASHVSFYNNDVTFAGRDKTTFNARDGTALAGHITLGSTSWMCKITLSNMGRARFNKTKRNEFVVSPAQASRLE